MNFVKTVSGIVSGAVASCAIGFVAATVGFATSFALVPALVFGAVVGLSLSVVNSLEPQGMASNAFIGGGLSLVGYMLTTAAAMTMPAAAVAVFTGAMVGWLFTFVTETN